MAVQDRVLSTKRVNWRDIHPLQPDNAKVIMNYEALEQSILKHGFAQPFYGWENEGVIYCIDGHTRKEVLYNLEGVPEKLSCTIIDAKDRKEAILLLTEVYNQRHNPFENEILMEWVEEEGFEDGEIHFESMNISFSEDEETQVDAKEDDYDIPDHIETDIVKGDLFEFKKDDLIHRLLCGDSTIINDVDNLMDGEKVDLVFTDPPYGVSYADKNKFLNQFDKGNRIQAEIKNDHLDIKELSKLWGDTFRTWLPYLNEYSSYYICSPQGGDLFMMMMMMNESGFKLRHCLIWNKNNHVLGRSDYMYKHEPILFGWANKHRFYGNGEFTKSVWDVNKPHSSKLHPTMKPVELPSNAIKNSSKIGQNIADFFLGSGTTMVASHQLNRNCYGMELDEKNCQIIIDRMLELDPEISFFKNGTEIKH